MICWSRDVLRRLIHNFYYVAAREEKIETRGIITPYFLDLSYYSPCDIMVKVVPFHYFPPVGK